MDYQVPEGKALLGYMAPEEGRQFLRSGCHLEHLSDEELENLYERAKEAVGGRDHPDLEPDRKPLDSELGPYLAELQRQPRFQQTFEGKDYAFSCLEIDKLLAYQKHIYTGHAHELVGGLDVSTLEQATKTCLPAEIPEKPIGAGFDPGQQAWTIFAPGADLRLLGNGDFDHPQAPGHIYGFAVGFGAPYVQVVAFRDRYFLKNGYHRVYALRSQGLTHVPCVVVQGGSYDATGGAKEGFFDRDLMMSEKPPTFADYFDSEIAPVLPLRPKTKAIRVEAREVTLPSQTCLPDLESIQGEADELGEVEARDTGYERFEVREEGWNTYQLEDGTILKLRRLLQRLSQQPGSAPGQVGFELNLSDLIIVTLAPEDLRGEPANTNHAPEELQAAIELENMEFEALQERPAVYETESGYKIQLQTTLTNVSRTSKYAASGDPIYVAQHDVEMNVQDEGTAEE